MEGEEGGAVASGYREVAMSSLTFARLSPEEREAVDRIVTRAVALYRRGRITRERADIMIDISVVHHKLPLRLLEMAEAPDFDLIHDISGINRHLDRKTGELRDCFVPRFARSER